MGQQLGALSTLPEDLDSLPSTHTHGSSNLQLQES